MAVERAPYINYTEITSYQEEINNGSEIPLFVVKTNNTVAVSDITPKKILRFVSYTKFKDYFSIKNDETYESLDDSIKDLDNTIKDFFVENSMYGEGDYGLSVPYILMIDVGNAPTVEHYLQALLVSETKRKSTVVLFPNCEDVNFMMQVDTQLKLETKTGLLRIGYFGVSSQGQSEDYAIGNILKPKTALEGYTEVVEVYKQDNNIYSDAEKTTEVTPTTTKIYLDVTLVNNIPKNKAYTYENNTFTEIEVSILEDVLIYESENDYKYLIPSSATEVEGNSESFNQFCDRMSHISNKVQSSRVAIVEKEYFGKTIARICSTPYYIEPGYLPYMSVNLGVFKEYTSDDRDTLFGTGLIFNEDDYTLVDIVPRICLATSTAWGISDHDMRKSDALIHARRNVDHQVRNILSILAPQLKRNETSVNLRFLENQLDIYLSKELDNGRIMEYAFEVIESSYNPYALKVVGKITPVNSTLAIEFENTVGSSHAIASDYV